MTASDERAVESVDQRVLDKQGFAEDHRDGARLAEHEQGSRNGGERSGREGHDGCLRQVGEDEHEGRHAKAEGDGWGEFLEEW